MKQLIIFLLLFLFTTASIGASLFGSEHLSSSTMMQNEIEIVEENEVSDIKEEPSHIHISLPYQEFLILGSSYFNPLHISDTNPFIPIKPPRNFS